MNLFYETIRTPCGVFSVAVNDSGAIAAAAFGDQTVLKARMRSDNDHLVDDKSRTLAARGQLLAYFAGERREFDLPLAANGTAFQQRVWRALLEIPFGQTRSYGQLAAQLGNPAASRAVGRANATNPICLIVPCHRVIGVNGSLTGFAFGEDLKRWLLAHERESAARRRAA